MAPFAWALPLVLFLPLASAAEAQIAATLTGTSGGTTIVLPESGQVVLDVTLEVKATGFVCPQGAEVQVEVNADEAGFPGWAGASVNPRTIKYTIASGEPGLGEKVLAVKEGAARFELNWDLENRPATNAHHVYKLGTTTDRPNAACAPADIAIVESPPLELHVSISDKPLETVPLDCQATPTPNLPECKTATTVEPESAGNAPGPGAAGLLLVTLAAAFALRRRA